MQYSEMQLPINMTSGNSPAPYIVTPSQFYPLFTTSGLGGKSGVFYATIDLGKEYDITKIVIGKFYCYGFNYSLDNITFTNAFGACGGLNEVTTKTVSIKARYLNFGNGTASESISFPGIYVQIYVKMPKNILIKADTYKTLDDNNLLVDTTATTIDPTLVSTYGFSQDKLLNTSIMNTINSSLNNYNIMKIL